MSDLHYLKAGAGDVAQLDLLVKFSDVFLQGDRISEQG
jgi:hypothetical protein